MNEEVTDDKYISLICNGEFDAIPDFKIGELFESFFDNINYNVIKDEKGVFVDFTGEAMCDDKPCNIIIRFKVDNNIETFEIAEIKVDDDILNECEAIDLLEDIAYVGGATLEDDYCDGCIDGDCSKCALDLDEEDDNEDLENDYDPDDEEYNDEIDDYIDDDNDDNDDDNNDD